MTVPEGNRSFRLTLWPGGSDRFHCRIALEARSQIDCQGETGGGVERNRPCFVAFAEAHDELPTAFLELDIREHEMTTFIQSQTSLEQQLHDGVIARSITAALSLAQQRIDLVFLQTLML